jgi:predicted metal-dependent hydrolase
VTLRCRSPLHNGDMKDSALAPTLPLEWDSPTHDQPHGAVPTRRPADATDETPAEPAAEQLGESPDGESVAPSSRPEVVVRTSTRRRKTATAYWEAGRIVVVVPAHVRRADRPELVDWLVSRILAKRSRAGTSDEALAQRTAQLADRYVGGTRPTSIRWVTNQDKRWGSCSAATGEIRLSHRLRPVPGWVLDATIVHELAHLLYPDHSTEFHEIANRYPRQKEASAYLEGYSLGLSGPTS